MSSSLDKQSRNLKSLSLCEINIRKTPPHSVEQYRADLEYQIQLISSAKLDISSQINDIVGLGSDMEPDSPEMKALENKKEKLYQAEKALDQQLQRFQTQLQMIDSEEQSVKQNLQQSIQRAYA